MKQFVGIILSLIIILACKLTQAGSFSGISPVLTATANARIPTVEFGISGGSDGWENDPSMYKVQSGDTVPALAARFRTSETDIESKNAFLLQGDYSTTLPARMPLHIDFPTGVDTFQVMHIIPNTYFVYGPSQNDFDVQAYIGQTNGWLKNFVDRSNGNYVSGIQILTTTAENYSISPRLLITLLEYQLHALTNPDLPSSFYLGSKETNRKTLGKQLSWAANKLNNGYYGWRNGKQTHFKDISGFSISPDPRDNAASVALIYYFSQFLSGEELEQALSPHGLINTYESLFGQIKPEADNELPLLPDNLQQPELILPLQPGVKWAYTGGPHSGWGTGFPYAAIDFAPPANTAGCDPSPYQAISASDGIISRVDDGLVVVDLDGDGYPQTGWNILYLHLAPERNLKTGMSIVKGENLGHPSCLGGSSNGRNIHIARLYNGEWISADGLIPMNLGGWVASAGEKEYKGSLTNGDKTLKSSNVGEWFSQLLVD